VPGPYRIYPLIPVRSSLEDSACETSFADIKAVRPAELMGKPLTPSNRVRPERANSWFKSDYRKLILTKLRLHRKLSRLASLPQIEVQNASTIMADDHETVEHERKKPVGVPAPRLRNPSMDGSSIGTLVIGLPV
jgi:hypothetical protein